MCGTLTRTLKGKTQLSTQIKFYKLTSCPIRLLTGCVPNGKMRHNISLEIKLQLKYG